MLRPALVVVLALAPACKKETGPAPEAKPPTADADADAGRVISKRATLFLDNLQIAEIDVGKASTYTPLQAMLPTEVAALDKWASIEIKVVSGHDRTLSSPAKTHPGEVAALFPDEGGIAFGFFLPGELAKKGVPKMKVPAVVEVRVRTPGEEMGGGGGGDGGGGGGEGGDRPAPTKDLKIVIKIDGKDASIDGEQLTKLPTTTAPVGDTDTPGWTVQSVLEAAGVDPKSVKGKIVMYGDEGANLILEPGDLDPATAIAFIKLNKQGKLRFRLFRKAGQTWDVAGELRGIASIETK